MKKVFSLLLIACLALCTLAACDLTDDQPGETYKADITLPKLEDGKLVVKVGDTLDLLKGVTAINAKGESVIDSVTVSHIIPVDENGKVTASGTYNVKFSAEIDGQMYIKYLIVEVKFEKPPTEEIIYNGDFETGSVDPFKKSEFDNGAANLSVVDDGGNKVLKVEVTAVSWQQASPRLDYTGIELDSTKYYEISFKAKADAARGIHVQVGQLLDVAPWYSQCGSEAWFASLTNEYQEFKYRFQPTTKNGADLSKLALLIEFGTMGKEGLASAATTCYLDDIAIKEVEDLGLKNELPLNSLVGMGEEAAAVENPGQGVVWYDQGGWCGTATTCESSLADGVVSLKAVNPAGSCWFAEQFFLASAALESGEYQVSFDLEINKAGKIQVNKVAKDVVEGKNTITLNQDVAKGAKYTLTVQFGSEANGNLGDFEAKISKIVLNRIGDIKAPVEYADPENIFGEVKGKYVADGEAAAKKLPGSLHFWYVQDIGWNCGPVVTSSLVIENGKLVIKSNQPADANWWATQVFLASKPIEKEGTHTVTFKVNASAPAKITVCGVVKDLVAGENTVSVELKNAAAAQILFSMQLGYSEMVGTTETPHPVVGDITLELTELAVDGKAVKFEGEVEPPAPVDNYFENIEDKVVYDGEAVAKAAPGTIHVWYVQDAGWNCGPAVTASAELKEGVLTLTTDQPSDAWWFATQIFLATKAMPAGSYQLEFKLNSDVAADVTICGKKVSLVVGENVISQKVTVAEGAQFVLSLQCGVDGVGSSGKMVLTLSDLSLKKAEVEPPVPQDLPITFSVNSAVGGAWVYIKANWTEEAYAVTAITPGAITLENGDTLNYTGEVGPSTTEANSFQMGAGYADARFIAGTNKMVVSVTVGGKQLSYVIEFVGATGVGLDFTIKSVVEA